MILPLEAHGVVAYAVRGDADMRGFSSVPHADSHVGVPE